MYLGTSRSARPLPRGVTGHVAHPSRSIHQDYGEPRRTAVAQGYGVASRGRRRLFGHFRNILIFVFLDENAEHVHERSKRMVFVFGNFVGDAADLKP